MASKRRERTCDGRKRHRSRAEAEQFRTIDGEPVPGTREYRCEDCGGWHVDWAAYLESGNGE